MSLFQCDNCGCVENTALSDGGNFIKHLLKKDEHPKAYANYKKRLGLKENEEFGKYCCVCSPVWYITTCKCGKIPHEHWCGYGGYGIGEPPKPKKWHNKFERIFLPKGEWHTNKVGNLENNKGEEDFEKYRLNT